MSGIRILYLVAKNELRRSLFHPINLVLVGIIIVLIYVNTASYASVPKSTTIDPGSGGDVFILAYKNILWVLSYLMVIFVGFYGLMSVSEERFKHVIDVLIVKPLYRRDVIIGKFIGLSCLAFIISSLVLLLTFVLLTSVFRPPLSMGDFLLRILSLDFGLTMICSLTAGLAMLASLLFKNILTSASVFITYLFADWNGYILGRLHTPPISPYLLFGKMVFPISTGATWINLFNANSFMEWFGYALPYIAVLLLLTLLVVLLDCFILTKTDDTRMG
ncbi:MAG: ABC-2 family transporter protein [Methanocella sp. PtaU1.Bin125]|nr:MAG: ABC-2 family transporter protein [Methanocella sp. PtaU1.Bin125]